MTSAIALPALMDPMYWLGDGGVFGSAVLVGVMVIIFVETGLLFPFLPRVGPALFKKDDSRFFKRRYLTSSHEFFERHGPRSWCWSSRRRILPRQHRVR